MSSLSNDFVTVDLRGLKAALVERARSEVVSVSVVVRRAVARELNAAGAHSARHAGSTDYHANKVSVRLSASEARVLRARARADGISMGAVLAALAMGMPFATAGPARADVHKAL